VNITGSWCPNCHDEAPFLAELYRKYRSQGLEVVALSFELAHKHGGGGEKIPLDDLAVFAPERSRELLALDEALDRLAKLSPRQGRIVELRFFAGLEIDEIAKLEGLSPRTVKHDWSVARAWLHREIARAG